MAEAQQVCRVQRRPGVIPLQPRGQGLAADGDPVGLLLLALEQGATSSARIRGATSSGRAAASARST
ncbi:hypothetical protein OTB20_27810 [Streptomyces sp. H27-H1]|uniref:hypothetical protein n=1 Tax=Streptomyces sp. H27-H1 TaxID=2996461 RepID=UPI00226D4E22|nr:hypothetical protein [Streptomyces sp. H27-H1]MCY0929930.1 hypothetical protein [Streptomyces sp. H27-H1]